MSLWSECYICGLDFPEEEMVRHYKTKRLVDAKCADDPSHTDYMNWMNRRTEERRHAEQPVAFQGEQIEAKVTGKWYVGAWYRATWREGYGEYHAKS